MHPVPISVGGAIRKWCHVIPLARPDWPRRHWGRATLLGRAPGPISADASASQRATHPSTPWRAEQSVLVELDRAQPRVAVRGRQRRQMGSLLKAFAHLVQWRIGFAPRLRQRIKIAHARLNYTKRINHLQRAILTNQLFRVAPQRLYVFRCGPRALERAERASCAPEGVSRC